MPTYTVEGIVLRRVNYGESDRILTVLTRDRGKIGVIARGVRKPRSKLASHTDLFMRSHMQLAQGRGQLEILTQAVATTPVPSSNDPIRLACASVCAELIDRAHEPAHTDAHTFDLLAQTLGECLGGAGDPRGALIWFAQTVVGMLGYSPELRTCAQCGKVLAEQSCWFMARAGGLVCRDCADGLQAGIPCTVTAIKVLRVIAAGDRAIYERLKLGTEVLRELETVIEAELAEHLDRQLRSMGFLRSMTATNL